MCAHRSNKYVQWNGWLTKLLLTFSSLGFNVQPWREEEARARWRFKLLRLTASESNYPSVVIEVAYPEILTQLRNDAKRWLENLVEVRYPLLVYQPLIRLVVLISIKKHIPPLLESPSNYT